MSNLNLPSSFAWTSAPNCNKYSTTSFLPNPKKGESGPLIQVPQVTTQENVTSHVCHVQCHNRSNVFTKINALTNGLGLPLRKNLSYFFFDSLACSGIWLLFHGLSALIFFFS